MVRVLHVIGGLQSGGAEALLYRLITQRSDFEHEVISLSGRGWYSSLLEEQGIKIHHLGISSVPSAISGVAKLNGVIRRSKADVIQGWMYGSNLLAGLLAWPRRIPVVWSIHSSTLEGLGRGSRAAARIGGIVHGLFSKSVINCSKRSAEFHERIGYSSGRTIVVPNGYDAGTYFPDEKHRSTMREALGLGNGIFVVGAIARWSTRKDLPNLLRAFALLARKGIKIPCLLIGRDLDQVNAELMGYVTELGVSDTIIPLGYRSDLPDVARAIDLHVLPSATEAFPNVVAETMLCATPNVVTDVGDAALMVGESGWIVEPRNHEALAEAMEAAYLEWKDKPELWQERREAARSRIADRFTFDSMARAYEEIWTKAAESARSNLGD